MSCFSNDALRAHGILPPKPPPEPTAEDIADAQPAYAELRKAALAVADDSDLAAMLSDSDLDSEDEKVLESYRAQRAKEMRQDAVRHRFGRIYPIQKPDYVREVNDASKEYSERNGTGVVCFLYKDGCVYTGLPSHTIGHRLNLDHSLQACELLKAHLQELAQQYSSTKFVSIIGNMCIENYPDRNLPTLILYRNGQVKKQIVGLPQGMQCTKKGLT